MSLNILGRGEIGKGAMRTDMVVNPLPLHQGQIEGGEVIIELIDSIEFIQMGSMSPFHPAGE